MRHVALLPVPNRQLHNAIKLSVDILSSSLKPRQNVVSSCEFVCLSEIRINESCAGSLMSTSVLQQQTYQEQYYSVLLAGIPQNLLDKIQKVMKCAACLVFRASKRDLISPLLSDLHWLSVDQRIQYKISTLCFNVISGSAPPYLSDLLLLYIPSRTLRSSVDTQTFRVPH